LQIGWLATNLSFAAFNPLQSTYAVYFLNQMPTPGSIWLWQKK